MSKIYNKYLELKEQDSDKLYLFRCGGFYIFLADDAKKINDYVVLKITSFAKNVDKCGFPIASLDSYLKVFQNHKLDVVVVENYDLYTAQEKYEKIIHYIQGIDFNQLTPIEAINKLSKLQEMCNGK